MTDEQIIKALRYCNGGNCEFCKALNICDYQHAGRLTTNAFIIINREQEKIRKLENKIKSEIIDEFVEKLKEKCYENFQESDEMLAPYVTEDDIEDIAKEIKKEE